MTNYIDEMIEAFETQIETCDLVTSRIVDKYVLADDSGHMLTTNNGVQPFRKTINEFEATRDRIAIIDLQTHVRDMNPDNPVAQSLKITTWKKCARKQRAAAVEILAKLKEAKQ